MTIPWPAPAQVSPARLRATAFPLLCGAYLSAIYGLPLALLAGLFAANGTLLWHGAVTLGAPLLYAGLLVTVAGLLSRPHQQGIVPGSFPRQLGHPVYFHRRLYGLCWTAVYYCTPVYHLCLALPWLKRLTLQLFGYRGSLDITLYPDTWIRDLPLLRLGPGVYLSNRASLGTNVVLRNGRILVDAITLEEGVLVGHLSVVGPGVHIGAGSEIGVGSCVGLRTRIGAGSTIGAMAGIEHGVRIGTGVHIGAKSLVGSMATLHDGVVLPRGALIPARHTMHQQRDAPRAVVAAGSAGPLPADAPDARALGDASAPPPSEPAPERRPAGPAPRRGRRSSACGVAGRTAASAR